MRQQNVQQQNKASEDTIRSVAKYWRTHPLPAALVACASSRDINCSEAIFLKLEIDFPGMPRLFGTLLTSGERFIRFEIETDSGHTSVECVEVWMDITSEENLRAHNPGFGVGYGALAIEVLREINSDA